VPTDLQKAALTAHREQLKADIASGMLRPEELTPMQHDLLAGEFEKETVRETLGPLTVEEPPSAADPTLAIAAYLKTDVRVIEQSGGRVFRPELPEAEQQTMPKNLVLVRPAGGGAMFMRSRLPVRDSRLDVICYGGSRLSAENLAREVARALDELQRSTWESVIVFWVRVVSRPNSAIDPNTNWPFALVTAQVMHSATV
jgi:hypothetical protein